MSKNKQNAGSNPFVIPRNSIPVNKYYGYRRSLDDLESIKVTKYTDLTPRTNVYLEELQMILIRDDIKPTDRILILHIILNLKKDSDLITLDQKHIKVLYNIGRTVISASITQLCKLGVIAKKERNKSIYWINPILFFRGSRPRLFLKYGEESQVLNVKEDKVI